MTLPFKGNPAKCPTCGGHFSFEEGLAVGMPMSKLHPGGYAVCVDCWNLAVVADDGETLRKVETADIQKIGRVRYAKIQEALASVRPTKN